MGTIKVKVKESETLKFAYIGFGVIVVILAGISTYNTIKSKAILEAMSTTTQYYQLSN